MYDISSYRDRSTGKFENFKLPREIAYQLLWINFGQQKSSTSSEIRNSVERQTVPGLIP